MDSDILFIGHRGCADQYPENTVRAFRRAGERLPALEVDIQRCGSGELVAFHDERLERLTDGAGVIAETPWERIESLEVLDSGESIPQFTSVLEAWPAGVAMNLDVHDPTIVHDVLERTRTTGFGERIILSSTDPDTLERAREWRSRAESTSPELGYSFHGDIGSNIDTAVGLDCTFVHVPAPGCWETRIVERAHDAGLAVDAWTITTREEAERTADSGVDAMTVDRWEFRDVV